MATLIFMPNSEWAINGDPQWSSDSYGADHAVLPYRGRRDKMAAFIDTIPRFFEMPGGNGLPNYPGMRSVSYRNSGGTIPYPQIDVEFVGFRRQGVPPVEAEDNTCVISAQGSGFDSSSEQTVSGTLVCLSPRTVWSWWEVTQPVRTAPRYATIRDTFDPRERALSMTIIADNGEVKFDVPLSAAVTIFNSLVPQPRIEFNVKDVVPGFLWKCTNTVSLALV